MTSCTLAKYLLTFATLSPLIAQTVSLSVTNAQAHYDVGATVGLSISATATNISDVTLVMLGDPFSSIVVPAPYITSLVTTPGMIGSNSFLASAILSSGQVLSSNVVTIDVEPTQTPISIQVSPSNPHFTFRGQQQTLVVLGQIGTSTATLSNSSQLSIVSSNPAVASVGADNSITALTSGNTNLQVTYSAFTTTIPVSVAITEAGDLDANGVINQDDVNQLLIYLNTTATITNDARDLNHDGRIDNTDANLLAAMCMTKCTVSQSFAATDVNMDGVTNCNDLDLVKSAMGTRLGQPGFNSHADIDGNGVVNVLDLARVAKVIPAGTACQ